MKIEWDRKPAIIEHVNVCNNKAVTTYLVYMGAELFVGKI